MRVLIIEDNADIVANLYAYLEPLGYVLDCAHRGDTGLAVAARGGHDAIVLDLMLPGLDGLELCRRLRRELRRNTPVLMLTARDTIREKVNGFDSGADDYLVKPFSMAELDVRLRALVRRARDAQADPLMRLGELTLHTATMMVSREHRTLNLTPTGFKLLARLMRQAPDLVTRQTLEFEIWGENPPDSDALRTHLHTLRQAIDKPFAVPMLRTVQGFGYRLVDPTAGDADAP